MYNESAKNATIKYLKDKRDKLTLTLPKGKKDEYKEYAQKQYGISFTEMLMTLIEEDMKKNKYTIE